MMMSLEEFLKQNEPDILAQYECYKSNSLPEIGSKVRTLVSGFGGGSGKILTVKGYAYKGQPSGKSSVWGNDYIELKDSRGNYLAEMENWWKQIVLINC